MVLTFESLNKIFLSVAVQMMLHVLPSLDKVSFMVLNVEFDDVSCQRIVSASH